MKKKDLNTLRDSELYNKWRGMRRKCKEKNLSIYYEWESFGGFQEWMISNGYIPNQGFRIHRINKDKGFSPENCIITRTLGLETDKKLLSTWINIRSRCHFPSDKSYSNYGSKGIRMTVEWFNFEEFKNWSLLNGYEPGKRLKRKNKNKDYEPNNCFWTTEKEHDSGVLVEINGIHKTLKEISRESGIGYSLLLKRYHLGMRGEEIISPKTDRRKQARGISITISGVTKYLTEWSREYGIHEKVIYYRYRKGVTGTDLLKPSRKK